MKYVYILTLTVLMMTFNNTDYSQHGQYIKCYYDVTIPTNDGMFYTRRHLIGKVQYKVFDGRHTEYMVDFQESLDKLNIDNGYNYRYLEKLEDYCTFILDK